MFIYSYSRISDLETSLDIDHLDAILEPELLSVKTYCLNQNWVINEAVKDTNCNWSLKFSQRENGKNLMRRLKQGDILLSSKLERIVSSSQEAVELIINLRNKKI